VHQSRSTHAVAAGFLGWTLDAFDFFIVVFMVDTLAAHFGVTKREIVTTLTATLALRPIGAVLFGLLADRYGRRIPLMANVVYFAVIEVLCGFAPTLAWLLLRRPSDLDEKEQALLKQLYERSPELVCARQLAQHFLRLVRERRGRELDKWVADVQKTGPPELRGFSRNLRRDWDAVHAGLTERWSYGSVEGNVNKLKVTKRQMFGRARFNLLRKRLLLAN